VATGFAGGPYSLAVVAKTDDRFADFTPYVAAIDERGSVFFSATMGRRTLFGSTVAGLALNPVSINDAGQLAIRVMLDSGRQLILRANSPGSD
jgi:hypothetical protein